MRKIENKLLKKASVLGLVLVLVASFLVPASGLIVGNVFSNHSEEEGSFSDDIVRSDGAFRFNTNVRITPSSQTVDPCETFSVDVDIEPGQPIKSWELRLYFDASLLQANSVTEGDLFSGHTTMFNNGSIDNTLGRITLLYNYILGIGNVSSSGTACTVSFTSTSGNGTSTLDLNSVGVTDETGYVPITVYDGSVTVRNNPPSATIDSISPNPAEVGDSVSFSGHGTDSDCSDTITGWNWRSDLDGQLSTAASFSTSSLSIGTHTIYFKVKDNHNAWSTEVSLSLIIKPVNEPPEFSNENPPDSATNVPITTSSLSIDIDDPEGDSFTWSIETSPNIGSNSGSGNNGTKTCSISGLAYDTTYTWYVNATDTGKSRGTTAESYTFTTEAENFPPAFSNENPPDSTTNVPITTSSLSIDIDDPEDDSFTWSIETSPNIGSNSGTGPDGTKTCSISGLAIGTTYTWYVNATDPTGSGTTTAESYTFTTEYANNPPVFSNENPSNGATDVSITTSHLTVYISDPEGDSFTWSIETSPDIGSISSSGNNGTKTCSVSGLSYSTTYTWYVNATDPTGSGTTTAEIYTFTTEAENFPPAFSNENPTNGATNVLVSTSSLSVYIYDPNGNAFTWWIETSPDIGSSSGSGADGTKTCSVYGLQFDTIYTWYVNATDPGGSGETTAEIYTFTTEEEQINNPPYKPTIDGPHSGKPGVQYTYTFNATDPDGDDIYYWIEREETSERGWEGPYPSGTPVQKTYTWNNEGTYTISCKVKDSHDAESEWTELDVTMPRNKQLTNSLLLQFLEKLMERFPRLGQILTSIPFFFSILKEEYDNSPPNSDNILRTEERLK